MKKSHWGMVKVLLILSLIPLMVAGCGGQTGMVVLETGDEGDETQGNEGNDTQENEASDILDETDLVSGGPGKDGIPSIDNPDFVPVDEADEWLSDADRVMTIDHMGIRRAYPLQILVWHEIVNDELAGDAVAVTYCPLCDSGIAFSRLIDGDVVEFGTSGKLYNSNLVMYDRKTGSYWTQVDGRAVIGVLSGMRLDRIPSDMITWGQFKEAYPDAEVLSRDTGYRRPYGSDPYSGYYASDEIKFPVRYRNDSIHPKTVVHGIHLGEVSRAYRDDDIPRGGTIKEVVDGHQVTVKRDDTGKVTVIVDGEIVAEQRMFWFAWYAFHPDTGVYDGS